jgi:hypothetical protein
VPPDPRFSLPRVIFFGVGAQKCGSTWLHDYLAGHPEIRVPRVTKELHYWNRRSGEGVHWHPDTGLSKRLSAMMRRAGMRLLKGPEGRARAAEWAAWERCVARADPRHGDYADVLLGKDGAPGRVAGEITPAYALLGAGTLSEMARLAADVRFIYQMRDPVDRAVSAARMNISGSGATLTTETLEAALRRSLDGDPDLVLARSRYDETLAKLEGAVGAEKLGVFFYETFFDEAEIRRLTAFLDVAFLPPDTGKRVNLGMGGGMEISDDLRAALRDRLSATYEDIERRFGARVPDAWCARP